MKRFQIGEIAKITGLSVHALRYYEKQELIKPSYVDDETGYRYYIADDVQIIEMIKECKHMDMSLNEIRTVLTAENHEAILDIIESKENLIKDQIEHLRIIKENIEWYRNEYETLMNQKRVYYRPFVQHMDSRKVIYQDNPYEESSSILALSGIAKDELSLEEKIVKKYGFIADMKCWKNETSLRVKGEYLLMNDGEYRHTNPKYIYELPAGTYLCMNIKTPTYLSDIEVNVENIPQLIYMKDYMEAHNYKAKMVIVEEFSKVLKRFGSVRDQIQILLEVDSDGEF